MIPYNERLWGVSPREITAAWCSRFVPLPNLEQVVAGAVGANAGALGYNAAFMYPKQGGIQTFAAALAGRLDPTRVRTSASLDALDFQRREVVVGGERVPYSAVVATLPLPELLKRMPGLPKDIEEHASRLRCTTLRYLDLATRSKPPADWHWVYVPEKRYPFYRVGIFSNAVASMAPPGGGSFYVELADRGPVSESVVRESAQGLAAMGAIASPDDVLFADARGDRLRLRGVRRPLLRGHQRHLRVPGIPRHLSARPLRLVDLQCDGGLPHRWPRGRHHHRSQHPRSCS